MKKFKIFTLLLAVVISGSFFYGCDRDLPSMSAKIDGTDKNFIFRSSNKVTLPEVGEGMVIIGTTQAKREGEYIAILIRGTEQKTYDLNVALDNGKLQCEVVYRPGGEGDDSKVYTGKSGTVTITEIDDKYISGTFEFELINKVLETDVINVNSGTFENLRYFKADLSSISESAFDL